ncbi:Uncharacterised protein [Vibrio cholerae]|nr:Uncharacterised protein [Vibrio cholerae]
MTTRAAIGTAETPAAPISGLISSLENLLRIFAIITPPAVPILKAAAPSAKIPKVSKLRKVSACNLEPTPKPKKMVTILISSFCAVLDKRSTTPASRIRFPKQNMPTKGVAAGKNRMVISSTTSGNTIFSVLPTWRS